ncbi:MAG: hypothetical protein P1U90_07350 [Akkermansiaceae bacterium]|nr:hypothetical protein [Akkermansiaceae bacterium]
MKFTKCITFTAVASFTMVGAITQAAAQEANARAHQLTTSLKIDVEGEEEVKNKDNGDSKWSQKVITQKVSNKEILEALVDAGVINDIKGWSIVLSSNDSAEVTGTWITKKKNTPINISEFFNANATDDLTISSYKGKFSLGFKNLTQFGVVKMPGAVEASGSITKLKHRCRHTTA